jgi:hypothetical protein
MILVAVLCLCRILVCQGLYAGVFEDKAVSVEQLAVVQEKDSCCIRTLQKSDFF